MTTRAQQYLLQIYCRDIVCIVYVKLLIFYVQVQVKNTCCHVSCKFTLLSGHPIGLYRENAIAVRVIDRSAYDATSRVHAHRQRKNMSYLRNGCCIYYLRPTGSAHL